MFITEVDIEKKTKKKQKEKIGFFWKKLAIKSKKIPKKSSSQQRVPFVESQKS
jgi:hypothetical protein